MFTRERGLAKRFSIETVIDAITLAVHCALAAVALVQFVALMLSGRTEGIIAGALFAAFVVPLLPAIRRVLIDRHITAALKKRTPSIQASLATIAGAAALVLLALACAGLTGRNQILVSEQRIGDWILGCALLWTAGLLRELPSSSK